MKPLGVVPGGTILQCTTQADVERVIVYVDVQHQIEWSGLLTATTSLPFLWCGSPETPKFWSA